MQTAAPIANVRAAEGERPESERLFVDPYARLFADGASEAAAFFAVIPFFEQHVRLRTRFIDDAVRRALAAGLRDIVLVGAGFDCRGMRLPEIAAANARVIEVDHGEQLDEKRRRLASAQVEVPPHVVPAPADLRIPGELERALGQAGVPERGRVLWVCEGLFGYLSPEALGALAGATGKLSGVGSRLVANFSGASLLPEFVSGVFANAGWRVLPTPSFAELHETYLGAAPPAGHEAFQLFETER